MEKKNHESTSLTESQESLEVCGCKPWIANLSIVPHTCALGILTKSITYCTILMFIRRDLFPPDSKFIQIFITGACKFIQIYERSCNNYASLLLLFLYALSKEFSTNPRCSSTSLPSLGPGYSSFMTFQSSPSLCQEVASASKNRSKQAVL